MTLSRISQIALATALALGASASLAAAEPLKVGFAAEPYPPFFEIDASGNWTGWELDIAAAICEKMQAECEFVPGAWDSLIPQLTGKKIDMIVASMSITEERKKTIAFSDPYFANTAVLLSGKDAPDATDPDTLKGKSVGVQQSTIHQTYAEEYFKDSDVKIYQTQDEANQDLASGRLDYVQADVLAMIEFIDSDTGQSCCKLLGPVADDPAILGTGVGIGMRKEDTELKARADAAIAEIFADGTFDRLTQPVFGDVDLRPKAAQ